MSQYKELRTKEGVLRVSLDQRNILGLMNNIPGKWIERQFVHSGKRMVFSFTEARVMTQHIGLTELGVEIYVDEGDYLDLNKE